MIRAGERPDEMLGVDFGDRMSVRTGAGRARRCIGSSRREPDRRDDRPARDAARRGRPAEPAQPPPAMCFLDIMGYTGLTQEHADAGAAICRALGQVVQRTRSGTGAGRSSGSATA